IQIVRRPTRPRSRGERSEGRRAGQEARHHAGPRRWNGFDGTLWHAQRRVSRPGHDLRHATQRLDEPRRLSARRLDILVAALRLDWPARTWPDAGARGSPEALDAAWRRF